jgi:hypothetical protein
MLAGSVGSYFSIGMSPSVHLPCTKNEISSHTALGGACATTAGCPPGSVGSAFSIGSVGSAFSIGSFFGLGTVVAVLSALSFGGCAARPDCVQRSCLCPGNSVDRATFKGRSGKQ